MGERAGAWAWGVRARAWVEGTLEALLHTLRAQVDFGEGHPGGPKLEHGLLWGGMQG